MGKNSHIEWTHHTFNPWWGCAKVSPACQHCYAEAWAKRVGSAVWGKKSPRRFFGETHWRDPIKWNAEAIKSGVRFRVFCASMADVFEDRKELVPERAKLWRLIEATPALDWLLLTKRPEHIKAATPWGNQWPPNVWLGTTVENQEWADKRLPHLLELGYKYATPFPIQKEGKQGCVMFWMIHASDHERATTLMNQAYNFIGAGGSLAAPVEQLDLLKV